MIDFLFTPQLNEEFNSKKICLTPFINEWNTITQTQIYFLVSKFEANLRYFSES
jgi:hypothetical protein